MPKISIEDLKKIKERERGKMAQREGVYRAKITVHMGTCGIAAGARDVMTEFRDSVAARGVADVIVINSGCAGLCAKEPMATVELKDQQPVKYILLDREKAKQIFDEHIMGGKPVEKYALAPESETTEG
ncbi:MAG: (2Fe-2S) ferredoxin domain-containing protein [Desulfomonilaceae bacterium]